MNKFFRNVFVLLCLVFVALPLQFVIPQKALAAEKKLPVTNLATIPELPGGDNGWFNKVTLIELKAAQKGKVYYQWNTTTGKWLAYEGRIRAWRGENVLYYYAELGDAKEAVKSKRLKVDYNRPNLPKLSAVSENEAIRLTWTKVEDANRYEIFKGEKIGNVSGKNNSFLDKDVVAGRTYGYRLAVVNVAGLTNTTEKVLVTVKAFVPTPAIAKIETPKTILSQIGKGASANRQIASAEVKKEKVEPVKTGEEPKTADEPKSEPVKNWNRLLVAISILVIAAGAAIGGYYGYEWWMARKEDSTEPTNSRKTDRW